jgi:hyperosmotically inducible protein
MKFITVIMMSLFLMSCAVIHGKSAPDEYVNDAGITTQIKTKLIGSDIVSAPTIHVETQNGVVQLSGFVSNNAQIQEAQNIARSVDGVKRVVSNLIISPVKKQRYQARH